MIYFMFSVQKKFLTGTRMPYMIERWGKDKGIVVDTKGHHYSRDPLPIKQAKKQMAALYIHADHHSSSSPMKK